MRLKEGFCDVVYYLIVSMKRSDVGVSFTTSRNEKIRLFNLFRDLREAVTF